MATQTHLSLEDRIFIQKELTNHSSFRKIALALSKDPINTRAVEVMKGREKRVFEECAAIVAANTAKDSKLVQNDAHGDMIVEVAESIAHNRNKIFIVILKNDGLIANVSDSAMVEVAATLGKNGPRAFGVGEVSTFYKGLIENQFAYERLTVEAYLEGSYKKALMALTLNRTVIDAKKARKVLDALIEANQGYWPALKQLLEEHLAVFFLHKIDRDFEDNFLNLCGRFSRKNRAVGITCFRGVMNSYKIIEYRNIDELFVVEHTLESMHTELLLWSFITG